MENNETLILELKKIVYENGSEEELNNFLDFNSEELLKTKPTYLIGYHVDFYLQRGLITKGLEILSNYKTKPYISMEVEDFMNELYNSIVEESSSTKKAYTNEDLVSDLFSDSFEKNLNALRNLSYLNVRSHINLVKRFLKEKIDEKLHRILLIILIEQGINEPLEFHLGGVVRKLIPNKITLPFETKLYQDVILFLNDKVKNPDSLNRLTEIFSTILTMSFPDNIFESYDIETTYNVLLRIEKEMLGYVTSPSSSEFENDLYEAAIVYFY